MEPRPLRLNGTTPWSSGAEADKVVAATAGLEAIARDRLSTASNQLAGIATSAVPDTRVRLLEVIADLDELGHELRRIIIVLRNGHQDD
jgi:hypothetical protein